MSQNSLRLSWAREEVDSRLHGIMKSIHKSCIDASEAYATKGDYVAGANIAGFLKVAKAMLANGIVKSAHRFNPYYAKPLQCEGAFLWCGYLA